MREARQGLLAEPNTLSIQSPFARKASFLGLAFAVENMIPVLDLALISYDPIPFRIKEIIQCDALDLALEYPLAEGLSREIPVQILDLYLATKSRL